MEDIYVPCIQLWRLVFFALLLLVPVATNSAASYSGEESRHSSNLRYLAINVGNASPQYSCWEYKLCRKRDIDKIREYIDNWQPDIILLSEVFSRAQLETSERHGPILPSGYTGMCGESRDRFTNELVDFDAPNASHEHECIAWKTSRVSYVMDSALSAYGRNDKVGRSMKCNYDFTGFRVKLLLDNTTPITAVTVHPNSKNAECRREEIARYWSELAEGDNVIIGGDWNTESMNEISPPDRFRINYSAGHHWDIAYHRNEYSAIYGWSILPPWLAPSLYKKLDHAFSSFGEPDTSHLHYGSALGGYDGHPRADGGAGCDHRQILVDLDYQ
jgi:hypothetical protein